MMWAAIVAGLVLAPPPPRPPLLQGPRHKYDYQMGRKRRDGGEA